MTKEQENKDIEYEKMIIDIPKNTKAVSVVSIFENGLKLMMNTHIYETKDVIERKVKTQK